MELSERVLYFIHKHGLIRRGDKIVVGLSGGADSVALLLVLIRLQPALGIRLHAAHLNHNLRAGADTDQRFVEKLCSSFNIPLSIKKWANPPSKNDKGSLENKARQQRHAFFREVIRKEKADHIALGHHKDDEAETVLMRIIRGTGLQGLRGMMPCTDIEGLPVIRPFLNISRNDIEAFLTKEKQSFCMDPTNLTTEYMRNKVRHEIVPFLAKYNGDIVNALTNLGLIAGADYEYLEEMADKTLAKCVKRLSAAKVTLDLEKTKKLHIALRRMMIRKAIGFLSKDTSGIGVGHILDIDNLILTGPGNKASLPYNIEAYISKNIIVLKKSKSFDVKKPDR
jgi:tRNA(Ile)-lysidine synthase